MAEIVCNQCGYANPKGVTRCEICDEPLVSASDTSVSEAPVSIPPVQTAAQAPEQVLSPAQDSQPENKEFEYFVICPESHTKTILPSNNVTSFFCEGCNIEHIIDGMIWQIEERRLTNETTAPAAQQIASCDRLSLEEISSHYVIEIDKLGGSLGRYGKYGAEFFQSRGMNTVSGEHCTIAFEFGNWVLRHVSRTNQTKYDNRILESFEPTILSDGKILTLANTVSFIVKIS